MPTTSSCMRYTRIARQLVEGEMLLKLRQPVLLRPLACEWCVSQLAGRASSAGAGSMQQCRVREKGETAALPGVSGSCASRVVLVRWHRQTQS